MDTPTRSRAQAVRQGKAKTDTLSHDDFLQGLKDCAEITEARDSLLEVHQLFSQTGNIQPAQCDEALDAIGKLRNSIQRLNNLLSGTDFPSTVSQHYSIIATLCFVDSKINELTPLIISFRGICRNISTYTIKHQQVILRKLESLMQSSEDLHQSIPFLFDQIRFLRSGWAPNDPNRMSKTDETERTGALILLMGDSSHIGVGSKHI